MFDVYSKEGGFAMIFCPVSGNWCGNYIVNEDGELLCDCKLCPTNKNTGEDEQL